MSGTFWSIEEIEPIIKERNELRQRVAELEAELNEWARSDLVERNERLEKALLKKNAQYKERGERMKYWRRGFLSHHDFAYQNPEAASWFNPETGKPL